MDNDFREEYKKYKAKQGRSCDTMNKACCSNEIKKQCSRRVNDEIKNF